MTFSDAVNLGQLLTFAITAGVYPIAAYMFRRARDRADKIDAAIAHLDGHAHRAARRAKRADKRQRRIEHRVAKLETHFPSSKGNDDEPVST